MELPGIPPPPPRKEFCIHPFRIQLYFLIKWQICIDIFPSVPSVGFVGFEVEWHGSPMDTIQNIGSHISHPRERFHSKFCTDKLDSTLKVSKFEKKYSYFKNCTFHLVSAP